MSRVKGSFLEADLLDSRFGRLEDRVVPFSKKQV
jgi:hypothetical protein